MAVLGGNTGPMKPPSTGTTYTHANPRPTTSLPLKPKFPGNTGPMKPSQEAIAKLKQGIDKGNKKGAVKGRDRAAQVHRRNAIRQGLKKAGKPNKRQLMQIRLGAMKRKAM